MVDRFEEALADGNPEAASIIIDFYGCAGTFLGLPKTVRAFCRSTAPTNLRDWRSAATFTPSFEDFAAVDLPITLVRGAASAVPIIDVTGQLVDSIPGASEKVVEGAGHFLISTHPAACAEILEAHIRNVER